MAMDNSPTMDILAGKWNQFKGKVRQQWGDLTDDDVARIGGNYDEFVGILQERYGYDRLRAEQEINDFVDQW